MTVQGSTAAAGLRPAAALRGADASVELARLGEPAGGPLLEQARGAARALAAGLGRAGDAVAAAKLEGAALDFGREVRALHIGQPDVPAGLRALAVDAALAAGADEAAALPAVGLDAVDRLVATLDGAARALADQPGPPLVGAGPHTQGA